MNELLKELIDAAESFLSGDIVDETSGTIPLLDRLRTAIEAAREALKGEIDPEAMTMVTPLEEVAFPFVSGDE